MRIARRAALGVAVALAGAAPAPAQETTIALPAPRHESPMSLDAALWARRSTRALARDSINLADVSQLLWAAQGANRPDGHRTAPSAGATYPLDLYLVAGRVRDLPAGVYRYTVAGHQLVRLAEGDRIPELVSAATRQAWQGDAAIVVVFAGDWSRAVPRFHDRADRYVPMDVGFAAQNLYLEAAALGLGTTFAGSFQDSALARVVGLPAEQRPLGIMPVGKPK